MRRVAPGPLLLAIVVLCLLPVLALLLKRRNCILPSTLDVSKCTNLFNLLDATDHHILVRGTSKSSTLRVRRGTIVYLVLGIAQPDKRWILRSTWQHTYVYFMSWRSSVTLAGRTGGRRRKFQSAFLPNSTWTTARNHLRLLVKDWEKENGWLFEFIVFVDEDVVLQIRPSNASGAVLGNESRAQRDEAACKLLHAMLLRDRPMLAGVTYKESHAEEVFAKSTGSGSCLQRCCFDHMLLVMHRTALDLLPYYDTYLDAVNWWSSAYIWNMYTSALVPQYCNYYYRLVVDERGQKHGKYPKRGKFNPARVHAGNQLARIGYPGFSRNMSPALVVGKLYRNINPHSELHHDCLSHPEDVDFSNTVIKDETIRYFHALEKLQV